MQYAKFREIKPQIRSGSGSAIKILHIVGGMNRGGIETWLMHILRNIDRKKFQMDFLVGTTEPCPYDDEIRTLGSRIIPCVHTANPLKYGAQLKRILQKYGSYDIVHSHVHHFSGYTLRLAKEAGVPVRIAHSHNDTSAAEAKAGWKRRCYLALMKWWISRYATLGLACSRDAAKDLYGDRWERNSRWQLLYYGLNLDPFKDRVDGAALRQELGILADAFVVGHVGRFVAQKNHEFILDIAIKAIEQEPKTCFLLVGNGSLHQDIKHKTAVLGLSDRVIFAGLRSDIPQLMLGVMDAFIFPSLHEGLGLVLIEAQAAGLPCVLSDVVPQEADVVKPLVKRMSLLDSASAWATELLPKKAEISRQEALSCVINSQFNLEISMKELEKIYQTYFIELDKLHSC